MRNFDCMLRPIVFAYLAALTATASLAQTWPQWGANPSHTQQLPVAGQNIDLTLVNIIYDQLVSQEMAAEGDELLAHFQAPLISGDDVYMMAKSGTFSSASFATQNWSESKFHWQNGTLVKAFDFATDWKPPGSLGDFWEPVFHPALANGALYVPGAGGSVFKVNTQSGAGTRINPFASIDPNTYVASPLTADASGNILYNVIRLAPSNSFYEKDVVDSWIVRIAPSGAVEKVSYSALTASAPRGTDLCENAFSSEPLPWPPSTTAVPQSIPCGTQRPGINASPAVAPDGTIYVVSRAHLNSRWSYLIAVTPDLRLKWISSLRDRMSDGCGVPISQGGVLPPNGTNGGCRAGATLGVDPATNRPGGGRVNDNSSATPVVAPDGSILYGSFTTYNYQQGHLMKFAPDGSYVAAYLFGWDCTPAIYSHDGTYSIITKDNHYGVGSYCFNPAFCGTDRDATNPESPEAYSVTQLSPSLKVEWSYKNTNTDSCTRKPDGTVDCQFTNPVGFEWCVNAFVVDVNGTVYANSEDGWLYSIGQGGRLRGRLFQQLALGAAYTPASMDAVGRVYSQNAGHLFIAGGERRRAVRH